MYINQSTNFMTISIIFKEVEASGMVHYLTKIIIISQNFETKSRTVAYIVILTIHQPSSLVGLKYFESLNIYLDWEKVLEVNFLKPVIFHQSQHKSCFFSLG